MTVIDKLDPKEQKAFLFHAQRSYKHSHAYSTTSVTVDTY
jgi:hypothetical protein